MRLRQCTALQRTYRIVHLVLILAYSIPPGSFCVFLQDQPTMEAFLREAGQYHNIFNSISQDPRNLTWVVQRGCCLYKKIDVYETIFFGFIFMVICLSLFYYKIMYYRFSLDFNHCIASPFDFIHSYEPCDPKWSSYEHRAEELKNIPESRKKLRKR